MVHNEVIPGAFAWPHFSKSDSQSTYLDLQLRLYQLPRSRIEQVAASSMGALLSSMMLVAVGEVADCKEHT